MRMGYFVWLLQVCQRIDTKDLKDDKRKQVEWVYTFVERSFYVYNWGSMTAEVKNIMFAEL